MAKILIDFDGTCIPQLPDIGKTDKDIGSEKILKKLIQNGHKLYLWTARNNSWNNPFNYLHGKLRPETSLDEAVKWFRERNIELSGINEVPGEEKQIGYSRKTLADYIIDDCALGIPIEKGEIIYYSEEKEQEIKLKTFWVNWNELEKILIEKGLIKGEM